MSSLTTRRPVSPTHHPASASLDLLHVSPYPSGGLAHTQPGVPASADHRNVQLAPPAGASNSFHPVASSASRHAGKGVNGGAG